MSLQTRLQAFITAVGADIKTLNTQMAGKLGTGAKAADSELLDGIDSASFMQKGSGPGVGGVNTAWMSTPNQRLKAGFYEISASALMPDTGWWHVQVYTHTNEGNAYSRQIAFAFGDTRIYQRKISAAGPNAETIAGNWSGWSRVDTDGATLDGGGP